MYAAEFPSFAMLFSKLNYIFLNGSDIRNEYFIDAIESA